MLEKLRNIFAVPELKRRILFTLALFAVYRLGEHLPSPGVNAKALAQAFDSQKNQLFGPLRFLRRRRILARHDLCARHHAVHLLLDHSAAARSGDPVSREAAEGRRGGSEEDHAAHALRHGADLDRPVLRLQRVPHEHGGFAGRDGGAASGSDLHAVYHHHPDDRHHLRDVAGGKDHRVRHRQRHR